MGGQVIFRIEESVIKTDVSDFTIRKATDFWYATYASADTSLTHNTFLWLKALNSVLNFTYVSLYNIYASVFSVQST